MASSTEQKHASWDGGEISEHPLFVALAPHPQKTIKTRCGKRVRMSSINNHDIGCANCLDSINQETQALEVLRRYAEVKL